MTFADYTEGRGRERTDIRGRMSEVRSRRTEVGGQTSEDRHRERTFGNLRFRSTWDIIEAAEKGLLPDKIMLTTYPQRWDDRFGPWVKELVWQNVKNVVKRAMLVYRNAGMIKTEISGQTSDVGGLRAEEEISDYSMGVW